jgi:hypothetical protein
VEIFVTEQLNTCTNIILNQIYLFTFFQQSHHFYFRIHDCSHKLQLPLSCVYEHTETVLVSRHLFIYFNRNMLWITWAAILMTLMNSLPPIISKLLFWWSSNIKSHIYIYIYIYIPDWPIVVNPYSFLCIIMAIAEERDRLRVVVWRDLWRICVN